MRLVRQIVTGGGELQPGGRRDRDHGGLAQHAMAGLHGHAAQARSSIGGGHEANVRLRQQQQLAELQDQVDRGFCIIATDACSLPQRDEPGKGGGHAAAAGTTSQSVGDAAATHHSGSGQQAGSQPYGLADTRRRIDMANRGDRGSFAGAAARSRAGHKPDRRSTRKRRQQQAERSRFWRKRGHRAQHAAAMDGMCC